MSVTIAERRAQINVVDYHLVRLLNRRARLAVEVGAIKRRDVSPLHDPERERQVLTLVCRANGGPFDDDAVTRIFRAIIHESRRLEESSTEIASDGKVSR